MQKFFKSFFLVAILAISAIADAQQVCWSVSDTENKAYKFFLETGQTIGSVSNLPIDPEAGTLNLEGDSLWILHNDDLWVIDLDATRPSAVLVNDDFDGAGLDGDDGTKDFTDYDAMTVDMNNRLWVASKSSFGALVVINPKTGNVITDFFGSGKDYIEVGLPSGGSFDCMAMDPFTGDLYANLNDGGGSTGDILYKINTSTGDTTRVAKFANTDFEGMGFDGSGNLWATTGSNAANSGDNNGFWEINLADATATRKHNNPGSDTETCDCVIGNPFSANEITGYVFKDADVDTTFDDGEEYSGVKVWLYQDINWNGKYDSATDALMDSTISSSNGYYYFRFPYNGGTEYYLTFSDESIISAGTEFTTDNIEVASFSSSGNSDANNNFGFINHASADQLCYTIADNDDVVYEYRLNSISTTIRSVSTPTAPEASTYNLAGDTLFILNGDDISFIDMNATTLTNVSLKTNFDGTLSGINGAKTFADFDAMSVDMQGRLWAASEGSDANLVVINSKTGDVIEDFFGTNRDYLPIPRKSGYLIDAMAIDPITNDLFATINTGNGNANEDGLYKINQYTGDTTYIGTFEYGDVEGMGFDALGRLLVTTGNSSSPASGDDQLWLVDINDASMTSLGNNPGADAETCDCIIGTIGGANEISGYVFWDANADTIFNQTGDTSHRDYTIYLYKDVDHDGIIDAGIDLIIDSVRTNSNGYYSFRRAFILEKQSYLTVSKESDLPSGNFYSTDNIESATFTSAGNVDTDNNFGHRFTGNIISGYVFYDEDRDTLYNAAGTDTSHSGYTVYLYNDVDGDGNIDAGVDLVIQTTTTNQDGFYSFLETYESGTENYIIQSSASQLPYGTKYSTDNIETAQFDTVGQTDENNNFGYELDSSAINIITGTVFGDENEDTIHDASERKLSGFDINLYHDLDFDGKYSQGDALLNTETTDQNGFYKFIVPYYPMTYTVRYYISDDDDDAEQNDGGNNELDSDDLDIGERTVGLRFDGVDIPKNATINTAYIAFYAVDDNSDAETDIYGYDSDNPSHFTSSELDGLTKTSATVNWDINQAWDIDTYEITPDLKAIVQELVNRSDWDALDAMAFIFAEGSGNHEAVSHNSDPTKAPYIEISYTIPNYNYFVMMIDSTDKPAGSNLTTDYIENARFNTAGNVDSLNDYGLWGGESLPVEWLSFTADKFGKDVLLKWITATELNNDKFVVQRSNDGITFEKIGEVTGNGSSNAISYYEFIDYTPKMGHNYYRLLQIDFDNSINQSEVRVVTFEQLEIQKMQVYPNPSAYLNPTLRLNHIAGVRFAEISVYSMDGKLLVAQEADVSQLSSGYPLNTEHLIPGNYLIRLRTNNASHSIKFIKLLE